MSRASRKNGAAERAARTGNERGVGKEVSGLMGSIGGAGHKPENEAVCAFLGGFQVILCDLFLFINRFVRLRTIRFTVGIHAAFCKKANSHKLNA